MLPPFDLSVPSDDRFRSLAPEAAAKYAELAGRPAADAAAFGAEVGAGTDKLARTDENIEVKLQTNSDGPGGPEKVVASLHCGGQSLSITSR